MSDASNAGARGILSRIAASAEYSIAAALLAVCLVVGGALWWLRPQPVETPEEPMAGPTAVATPVVDERAAMDDWKRRLDEQFSALDEQQRQRAAAEEESRERQRAEEAAAAESRRQAEQARRQAEAEARARARNAAPTPSATPAARVTSPPTAAPTATAEPRAPVAVAAAIDWSSCSLPKYPSLSVNRGEEGVVVIAVELDAAAQILQARVTQSSGHSKLDRATLDAVRKCQFTPAAENGVAKAATADVRFTWKLSD